MNDNQYDKEVDPIDPIAHLILSEKQVGGSFDRFGLVENWLG